MKYILARHAMINMLTTPRIKKIHVFSSKGMLQAKNIIFWSKLQPNYNSMKEMKLSYLQSDSNIARNMNDYVLLLCALIIGSF